jgi:hypothetical protein
MKVPRHLATISIVLAAGLALAACGDEQDKPASTTTDTMMTGTTDPMMTGTTDPMMDHPTTTTGG